MTSDVSPKVLGGSFGAALAALFWTIAATTFWEGQFTDTEIAALTGSTAVVISALVGYLVPDNLRRSPEASPAPLLPLVPPISQPTIDPYDPYA